MLFISCFWLGLESLLSLTCLALTAFDLQGASVMNSGQRAASQHAVPQLQSDDLAATARSDIYDSSLPPLASASPWNGNAAPDAGVGATDAAPGAQMTSAAFAGSSSS